MRKKVALVLIVLGMMVFAVSCKSDCKAKGCSEKVFKKGFCEEHYYENAIEEGLEDLGDMFE